MKKLTTICLLAVVCVLGVSAQGIYDMKVKRDADYDKKSDIKWNFTKFLVSRDGRVVKRYEPTDKISNIEADITSELNP